MPALAYPTQATIDTWNVRERGIRGGSSSPSEVLEVNNSTAERVFRVKWAFRKDFVKYMLGYGATWLDAGVTPNVTRLSRLLPRKHPDYPDLVAARVTRIVGHKWTASAVNTVTTGYAADPTRCFDHPAYQFVDAQINQYQDAEVTIEYEHADYDRVEDADVYGTGSEMDRYVTRGETTPSAETLQLPGAVMQYTKSGGTTPNGIKVPFNSGKVIPQEKFVLTWRRLPENVWTPDSTLYQRIYYGDTVGGQQVAYLGAINRAAFYGRVVGTVLLEAVRPILKKSPTGAGWEWDIEYTFNHKPSGWNWLYYYGLGGNAAFNDWYFVSKNGTAYTADVLPDNESIYNSRDLNRLFSVN